MSDDEILALAQECDLGRVLAPICEPNPPAFVTSLGYKTAELLDFAGRLLAAAPVAQPAEPVEWQTLWRNVVTGDEMWSCTMPTLPGKWAMSFKEKRPLYTHPAAPVAQPAEPHLFEFWWGRYMPHATQAEAWEAWIAAPRADGVGVAAAPAAPATDDAKDAERYRWLRDRIVGAVPMVRVQIMRRGQYVLIERELDAAIAASKGGEA